MIPSFNIAYKHASALLIIAVFSIIALFTLDDHGLTWDETQQRIIGETNYNYVFKNDSTLLTFPDRDYGVAFELPLMIIEKSIIFSDFRDVYLMRHLFTHLLFLISGFFLYLLIFKLTSSRWLSIIGLLMLFLNPRIYAHSFFNTKDIPFMSVLVISFYFLLLAFQNKTYIKFILLAAVSAILINLRIIGIILPVVVIFYLLIDALQDKTLRKANFKLAIIYLLITFLILWLSWPYLWTDPFLHLKEAFLNMAHFRLNIETLFQGELIKIYDLPKSYPLIWVGLTVPILFLLSSIYGIVLLIYKTVKSPKKFIINNINRNYLVYSLFLIAPLAAIFILNSVVYDGWRQLYFIYPCLVLMTIFALQYLIDYSKRMNIIIRSVFTIYFFSLSLSMIKSSPNQQVYFNEIFMMKDGDYLRKNYELDYWGASYLTALTFILENDPSDSIKISVANYPGHLNTTLLNPNERSRVIMVDSSTATYFISNFRWQPNGYPQYKNDLYHSIMVQKNEITTIYKLR